MSSNYYSTPKDVINYSGATPEALGLSDTAELNELVETYLIAAKDAIDSDRNRTFTTPVPALVDNIAIRIAANMVRMAERQRNRSVVAMDATEPGVMAIEDVRIFTASIKADLMRVPKVPRLRFFVHVPEDKRDDNE
jgi:hypothetical protein